MKEQEKSVKIQTVGITGEEDAEELLAVIMEFGVQLFRNGAEAERTEDTIRRLCSACQFTGTNVFCIVSCIIVSTRRKNGKILTQSRRINGRETNLGRVERLNSLSRKICCETMTIAQVRAELARISRKPETPLPVEMLVYGIISFAFSVFFGGTCQDGCCAFLSGIILYTALRLIGKLSINNLLQTLLGSAAAAAAAAVFVSVGIGDHVDKVIIGNIMLVIPGVLLTTSIRDMINGDLITGLLGICEAVFVAAAVALGFASVVSLFGKIL
jgi:uncharacterized membrane protein YjjP (DUF1212 family)